MRHGSQEFYRLLEECANLHENKSHDYASEDNPFGNYHFAGMLSNLFSHSPHDAGFVGRIGEKIYRLANLEGGTKTPKNESIDDTEKDIVVITALWIASRRDARGRTATRAGSETPTNSMDQGTERLSPRPNESIRDKNLRDFARAKAEEVAGTFIPNRVDAIEPFSRRLIEILLEWGDSETPR